MAENTVVVGAGAGIVGLLVGFLAGGPDTDDLAKKVSNQVAGSAETVAAAGAEQIKSLEGTFAASAEQLSAMDEKIAGLEKTLASVSENQAASSSAMDGKLDNAVLAITKRLDELSESGTAQAAKIESALSEGLGKLEGSIGQAVAAIPAATAPQEVEEPAAPTANEPEIKGVKVGQTEIMMDGAVRVFISGVDQEAKTARVAVNGLTTQILGGYKDVTFMIDETTCALLLDDIVQGHVQLSAECGE
ncbi:MAG: hypothetical protein AAF557_08490 [Pseudomonadota bacterium]